MKDNEIVRILVIFLIATVFITAIVCSLERLFNDSRTIEFHEDPRIYVNEDSKDNFISYPHKNA